MISHILRTDCASSSVELTATWQISQKEWLEYLKFNIGVGELLCLELELITSKSLVSM